MNICIFVFFFQWAPSGPRTGPRPGLDRASNGPCSICQSRYIVKVTYDSAQYKHAPHSTHHTPHNTHGTIYIAQYTLHATCILNTTRYTLCATDTAQYTLRNIHWSPHVTHYTQYAHSAPHATHYPHATFYILYTTRYTLLDI